MTVLGNRIQEIKDEVRSCTFTVISYNLMEICLRASSPFIIESIIYIERERFAGWNWKGWMSIFSCFSSRRVGNDNYSRMTYYSYINQRSRFIHLFSLEIIFPILLSLSSVLFAMATKEASNTLNILHQ